MTPRRVLYLTGGTLALVTALAGCSDRHAGTKVPGDAGPVGSASTSSAPAPPSTTASPSSSAAPVAASSQTPAPTVTGTPECTADMLTLGTTNNHQNSSGAAALDLVFTNKSSGPCTMTGAPTVYWVAGEQGVQVGPPAVHGSGNARPVTVAPGRSMQAGVVTGAADGCASVAVRGFRVYPPGDDTAMYAPFPYRVCKDLTGKQRLTVWPVG